MHNFNIGDTVFAMSQPTTMGFYMGLLNNFDVGASPLAVCVAYADDEYYVGMNSVYATSSEAHAASTKAIDAIVDIESTTAPPLHLVAVSLKKGPRKKKAAARLAA